MDWVINGLAHLEQNNGSEEMSALITHLIIRYLC